MRCCRRALQARVDTAGLLDLGHPIDATAADVWSALVEFGLPGLAADESLGGPGARDRGCFTPRSRMPARRWLPPRWCPLSPHWMSPLRWALRAW